jgi:hypothetical protein
MIEYGRASLPPIQWIPSGQIFQSEPQYMIYIIIHVPSQSVLHRNVVEYH